MKTPRATVYLATLLVVYANSARCCRAAEEDTTITPGTKVGVAKLGMKEDQITKAMGKHDGEYSLPSGIKVEYSEWKESGKVSPIMKVFYDTSGTAIQIACTAPLPATADGISTRSKLSDVTAKYQHLTRKRYTAKEGIVDYLDDKKHGVAFEFVGAPGSESSKKVYAILVHKPGKSLIADLGQHPQ